MSHDPDDYLPSAYEVYYEEIERDRLQGFYLGAPDCAVPAFETFEEANQHLAAGQWRAAVVLAGTAIETCLRDAILRPLVCGLVLDEELADTVAEHALSHSSFDRIRKLLFELLKFVGGVDIQSLNRKGQSRTFWDEFCALREARNRVVHRGERADDETAANAVALARETLETVLPAVVKKLGFSLKGNKIVRQ